MRLRHLYLSSGHAFFGRYGQSAADFPVTEVDAVECVAGFGLRGDRFFGYRPDYKGQITFFAWETFLALREALALPDAVPSTLRRNAITEGIDLNALVGEKFSLQGVSFQGVEECRPCYWMDRVLAPGAEAWLKGRGGLRAKILSDGWLRVAPDVARKS